MEQQIDAIFQVTGIGNSRQDALHDAPPQLGEKAGIGKDAGVGEKTYLPACGQ